MLTTPGSQKRHYEIRSDHLVMALAKRLDPERHHQREPNHMGPAVNHAEATMVVDTKYTKVTDMTRA